MAMALSGLCNKILCLSSRFHDCRRTVSVKLIRCSSSVMFTADRYPGVKRRNFASIGDEQLAFFESVVGVSNVLKDDLDAYNIDWLKTVRGQSRVVLRPGSVIELSTLLRYCNYNNIAICPQGGNTGLVGGSVPVFDEVIVSMSRINMVSSIDPVAGVITCGAGCVLENLEKQLLEYGLVMPLDLGAKGSCQIGGNISTNAGGIRLLRYGSLHGNVLGLQAVLANGDIIDNLNPLIKDNTGYDLKHLFIGAEGTLGLVTAACIKCPPAPASVNVALLGVDTFKNSLQILPLARKYLGEILSAFEFFDIESKRVVSENLGLINPLPDMPCYLLIEVSGSEESHDKDKIEKFLQHLMDEQLIKDGTVAADRTQMKHIWSLRERIAEALLADGYCYKYDISLPLSCWYDIVDDFRVRLRNSSVVRVTGYGHLGDGNLHLNMTSKEYNHELMDLIEPYVYDWTASKKGSISAEHGLGFKKSKYIYHSKTKQMVDSMRIIKNTFDPKGILNPYKYLPDQ